MVSLTARRVLRLHRGYAAAPDRVLRAIVRFLDPKLRRALRRGAEREFLAFPVEHYAPPPARPLRSDRNRNKRWSCARWNECVRMWTWQPAHCRPLDR